MAMSSAWVRVGVTVAVVGGAAIATFLVSKLLRKKERRPRPKKVLVCVTAFGRFNGVTNNPTEVLLKELPKYLRVSKLPANVSVDRIKLLEVSGEGSLEELTEVRHTAVLGTDEARVWLHLGVDSASTGFKLERTAWNEANFRVPDERGWEPASQAISQALGKTSAYLRTRLPIGRLCKLLKRQGFNVSVSNDPGRFVCNWIFFQSLCACREADAQTDDLGFCEETAMFLHVPPFEAAAKDVQLSLVRAVLTAIGDEVCGPIVVAPRPEIFDLTEVPMDVK